MKQRWVADGVSSIAPSVMSVGIAFTHIPSGVLVCVQWRTVSRPRRVTPGPDLARFKRDERNKEWVGLCSYHKAKINTGCFHYHDDGRFNCFVCLKGFSGRGAIDFVKFMQTVDFQQATEFLRPLPTLPS